MSASQVAAVMSAASRERWPDAEVEEVPLADGGEGTLDVLAKAMKARIHTVTVQDPLGRPKEARFGISGGTALIEVAQACGLSLLAPDERHPLETHTYGLGELLVEAYRAGASHYIIALGGSATCDGGKGMLDVPGIDKLKGASFEILCDVDAPFVGPRGAARVFAPQKGATPLEVEQLEDRMLRQATWLYEHTGVDVSSLPGAGAAGGLGGAFIAYFSARAKRGIDRILDLVQFEERLHGAQLVITGEGRSDAQTLMGKVPYGVLRMVQSTAATTSVALVSGRIEDRGSLVQAGFGPIIEVTPRNLPLAQALDPACAHYHLCRAIWELPFPQ